MSDGPMHIGWCQPCGKRRWASRTDGKKARKLFHPGDHLSVYRCPTGNGAWHIGHLPAALLHGEIDRDVLARHQGAKR